MYLSSQYTQLSTEAKEIFGTSAIVTTSGFGEGDVEGDAAPRAPIIYGALKLDKFQVDPTWSILLTDGLEGATTDDAEIYFFKDTQSVFPIERAQFTGSSPYKISSIKSEITEPQNILGTSTEVSVINDQTSYILDFSQGTVSIANPTHLSDQFSVYYGDLTLADFSITSVENYNPYAGSLPPDFVFPNAPGSIESEGKPSVFISSITDANLTQTGSFYVDSNAITLIELNSKATLDDVYFYLPGDVSFGGGIGSEEHTPAGGVFTLNSYTGGTSTSESSTTPLPIYVGSSDITAKTLNHDVKFIINGDERTVAFTTNPIFQPFSDNENKTYQAGFVAYSGESSLSKASIKIDTSGGQWGYGIESFSGLDITNLSVVGGDLNINTVVPTAFPGSLTINATDARLGLNKGISITQTGFGQEMYEPLTINADGSQITVTGGLTGNSGIPYYNFFYNGSGGTSSSLSFSEPCIFNTINVTSSHDKDSSGLAFSGLTTSNVTFDSNKKSPNYAYVEQGELVFEQLGASEFIMEGDLLYTGNIALEPSSTTPMKIPNIKKGSLPEKIFKAKIQSYIVHLEGFYGL